MAVLIFGITSPEYPMQRPLCRSALYIPGHNLRALEKAESLAPDSFIFELEDAVAPGVKEEARQNLIQALSLRNFGNALKVVRINDLSTPWGEADLKALPLMHPDAVLIPKVRTTEDVTHALKEVTRILGEATPWTLWLMLETPLAILNCRDLARLASRTKGRLTTFVLGTNDLAKETRMTLDVHRTPLLPIFTHILLAARAYEIDVIDGVWNTIKDMDGFREECRQARAFGMDGKSLNHPSQIEPAHAIFSPTQEEQIWAQKIIEAFARPENERKGVISLEGQMVERLHLASAQRLLGKKA